MDKKKLSLENIKGKLSRMEMKSLMAGSGDGGDGKTYKCCTSDGTDCSACYSNPDCFYKKVEC